MKKNKITPLNAADSKIKNIVDFSNNININIVLNSYFLAGADPANLAALSKILEKEIISEKDTEDYNRLLVSEVINKTLSIFMESGVKTISSGDVLKLSDALAKDLGIVKGSDFEKALTSKDYQDYPFSAVVSEELRNIFLLKTTKKDTKEFLIQELLLGLSKYLNSTEIKIIENSFNKSEKRLSKGKVKIINPLESLNTKVAMSEEDKSKFNLEGDFEVEERSDSQDLLSLREMLSILSGETVHPLSIGLGAFSKILPELLKEGIDGIILEVDSSQKLAAIKLGKHLDNRFLFSPVEAAALLKVNDKNYQDKLNRNHKFYVLVEGAVAIPSKQSPYQYESFSVNDKSVKAGEVFLFESKEHEKLCTRIYFTPYDYSDFHIYHQHGSVIFGSNDQSFQSCLKSNKISDDSTIDLYKDWWRENSGAFEESVTAVRVNSDLIKAFPEDIFKEKYLELLKKSLQSISEINRFTLYYEYGMMIFMSSDEYSGDNLKEIMDLTSNYAPLSRRWFLNKYIEDSSGIMKEIQMTYYRDLSNRLKLENALEFFEQLSKIKDATNLAKEKNIDFNQAFKNIVKK